MASVDVDNLGPVEGTSAYLTADKVEESDGRSCNTLKDKHTSKACARDRSAGVFIAVWSCGIAFAVTELYGSEG